MPRDRAVFLFSSIVFAFAFAFVRRPDGAVEVRMADGVVAATTRDPGIVAAVAHKRVGGGAAIELHDQEYGRLPYSPDGMSVFAAKRSV